MAQSPAHKFGQLIGTLVESAILSRLENFCNAQGLYLDYQGRERPARSGNKVTWVDALGNKHDLDFVIEQDGTDNKIGNPAAFIESAWRRYTRHSKNKAQEIQGAILPLAEKYRLNDPFLGVILAGVFTEGAIDQLRSLGFHVLYLPYDTIVASLRKIGIDIAFDDSTPDSLFKQAASRIENTPQETIVEAQAHLLEENRAAIVDFFSALRQRFTRRISRILVTPLYGQVNEFDTTQDAINFLDNLKYDGSTVFKKYEIRVDFSNGDKVEAIFDEKKRAIEFLEYITGQ